MRVTKAEPGDIPDLCALLGILFSQETEFIPDAAIQAEGLRRIIGHPERGVILVLRDGDGVIGMVNLLTTVSTALGGTAAILEDMIIRPGARGTGAGSILLEAAVTHARDSGCGRITLLTDPGNTPAHRFYERHGFIRSQMLPFRMIL